MLVTVTMNPSVDISYPLATLRIDEVNRVQKVTKTAGGKGLNVARVAAAMDFPVSTTGIIGGTIGDYIMHQLDNQEIAHDFHQIGQESRNCIAILHEGKQTEILEAGPTISELEADSFLTHFQSLLAEQPVSVLTISGSLPQGLTAETYKEIIRLANQGNIPVVLDTSGPTLVEILEDHTLKIAAIKPNKDELAAIEGGAGDDLVSLLAKERYANVEWVIVTLGSAGAFAKHHDRYYQVRIPKITVVNPVGSGDATVAGIAMAISKGLSDEDLLKTAMTTGMLNTMEATTGHVNKDNFETYFSQVTVSDN
ncbi:hexose kinase [Jeotgalibaca sp. A127]|uniref:hexose kinase n=1 Tax=Jeotgalibaca sp. A127 TaxID=3457324 RepID=UPI003FD349F1